jgi:hypothetical protein
VKALEKQRDTAMSQVEARWSASPKSIPCS